MTDRMTKADKTDRLQATDKGLKEKRVNPDVLDSVNELQWQQKMKTDILLTIPSQTGTHKIQQRIPLTMNNPVM